MTLNRKKTVTHSLFHTLADAVHLIVFLSTHPPSHVQAMIDTGHG